MEIYKVGGEVIDKFLKNVPCGKFILVHGAGGEISKKLKERRIKVIFKDGQRFTSKEVLNVVEEIFDRVREKMVLGIEKSVGIRGDEYGFIARKIRGLGYVGEIVDFPHKLIMKILSSGYRVIISPLAKSIKGELLNVNADLFTASLTDKIKVEKLKFFVDTDGIMDEDRKVIDRVARKEINELLNKGVINKGMLVKVKAALKCKRNGIRRVFIGKTEIL